MKLNFIQRYFGPDSPGSGINPVGAGIASLQAILGTIQTISGDAKAKKLMAQRTGYVTPDAVYKALNLDFSTAQGDTVTRDYQTNQLDRMFSQALGVSTRLGGDANDLSALFDKLIQGKIQVGQEFHKSNMEGISKVLQGYETVASNKAAEWSSQQDILKDKIQAASGEKAAGVQNIGSAANAFISMGASAKTGDLYKDQSIKFKELLDILKNANAGGVDGGYNPLTGPK